MAGKGSKPRPHDKKKFDENYDRIFNKDKVILSIPENYVDLTITEELTPVMYRLAIKPNGTLILQGGFKWSNKISSGINWRDVPTVKINNDGSLCYGEVSLPPHNTL